MEIDLTFKNLDATEALKTHVRERTDRLKKYFDGKLQATWICYISGSDHVADLKVHASNFEVFSQAKTDDLYKSIDEAVEHVDKQLRKHKEIQKNHHHPQRP